MIIDNKCIANRVRLGRMLGAIISERGISLKELSFSVAISEVNLSRIIQGKFSPTIDTYERILRYLGLKLDFSSLD